MTRPQDAETAAWVPKPGDRVRCIDDRQHIPLRIGAEYTVQWVSGYGCLELVEFPMRDIGINRFAPVSDRKSTSE